MAPEPRQSTGFPAAMAASLLLAAANLAAVVVAAALVAAYPARGFWPCELASYGMHLNAACAACALAVFLLLRCWKRAAAMAAVLAVGLLALAPFYLPPANAPRGEPNLRVMSANLLRSNCLAGPFRAAVEEIDPDVLFLQEFEYDWCMEQSWLFEKYPYHPEPPMYTNTFFSKYPLGGYERIAFPEGGYWDAHRALLQFGKQSIHLLNMHPPPPMNSIQTARMNAAQIRGAARLLESETGLVIVAGDMNQTRWSPDFRAFLRQARLRSARLGHGIKGSHTTLPWPFRLPIDHILHSPEIASDRFWLGPDIGSDHFPIVADLSIPSAE